MARTHTCRSCVFHPPTILTPTRFPLTQMDSSHSFFFKCTCMYILYTYLYIIIISANTLTTNWIKKTCLRLSSYNLWICFPFFFFKHKNNTNKKCCECYSFRVNILFFGRGSDDFHCVSGDCDYLKLCELVHSFPHSPG
jgi:hypothetical protein